MALKTSMYDQHIKLRGKMVLYAGYYLPIQYDGGIMKEHMSVRNGVGIFDVSHMGELLVVGKSAKEYVSKIITNSIEDLKKGHIRYSLLCNGEGGIVDDILIYCFDEEKYLFVVNAANTQKDLEHILKYTMGDVAVMNVTESLAQIALQGKYSVDLLKKIVKEEEMPKKYYTFVEQSFVKDIPCFISKTGYTGDVGYEIYCNSYDGTKLWELLIEEGKEYSILPCGLGARDTLRLEAGMPLYGHELSEKITPYDTGLERFVRLEKDEFIGKEALVKCNKNKTRVGIKVIGRGIARENYDVIVDGKVIGRVTSGTYSPYFNEAIAMAIIEDKYKEVGTKVDIMIREKLVEGIIVPLPFYRGNKN